MNNHLLGLIHKMLKHFAGALKLCGVDDAVITIHINDKTEDERTVLFFFESTCKDRNVEKALIGQGIQTLAERSNLLI